MTAKEPDTIKLIPEPLLNYKIKLTKPIKDYKVGDTLDAILLPIRVGDDWDKWISKWFIYSGERLIDIIKKEDQCFELTIAKKKGKG